MPGGIYVSPCMGTYRQHLYGPPEAFRKILLRLDFRKKGPHALGSLLVVQLLDPGYHLRRVRGESILQSDGKVYKSLGHNTPPPV